MEAAGLTPVADFPGSQPPWPCICNSCGRATFPRYNSIQKGQGGCKPCGYRKVSASLTKTHEHAVQDLAILGLIPLADYPGAHEKWLVECLSCEGRSEIVLADRKSRGRGCADCSIKARVLASRRPASEAVADLRQAGFEPIGQYPGSNNPWPCIHLDCGRETTKRLGDIRMGRQGCFYCAKSGFRFGAPAILYVLEHQALGAIKVGVTGQGSGRMEKFGKAGWVIIHKANFAVGADAFRVEQKVLRVLREELSLSPFLRPEDMAGMGGYSETFDKNKVTQEQVLKLAENGEEK